MASYNELNALIDAYINRNGVQAITGQILNGVLKAMVEQLGRGYTIMGAAIPTTDPGTPDGPECYFASETGTYTDFDGLQVAPGELALLCYTPSDGWTKATIYEGFQEVQATIDGNVGTPAVNVTYVNGVLSFDFSNMKGNTGAAAGFGNVTAAVDGTSGTPGVSVQTGGPDTAKNIAFQFTGLKGETGVTSVIATVDNTSGTPQCAVSLQGQQLTLAFTGLKGAQGNTGSSVDYPYELVNNLTTNDATKGLSAAQGVVLQGELSQLEAEVDDFTGYDVTRTYTPGPNRLSVVFDKPIRGGFIYRVTYVSCTNNAVSLFRLYIRQGTTQIGTYRNINLGESYLMNPVADNVDNFWFYTSGTIATGIDIVIRVECFAKAIDGEFSIKDGTVSLSKIKAANIDATPTESSTNLVKSGGVYNFVKDTEKEIRDDIVGLSETNSFTIPSTADRIQGYNENDLSPYAGQKVLVKLAYISGDNVGSYSIYFYDGQSQSIGSPVNVNVDEETEIELPTGVSSLMYFKLYAFTQNSDYTFSLNVSGITEKLNARVNSLEVRVSALEGATTLLDGKKVVCFGDSIWEFVDGNGNGIVEYLKDISGNTEIYKGAIGGSRLRVRRTPVENPTDAYGAYGALDIEYLVRSWASNSWTYVDNAVTWLKNNTADDNTQIINNLKSCPVVDADIVLIAGGTNDFKSGVAVSGSMDALQSAITDILTANPKIKVFYVSPIVRYLENTNPPADENWCDVWQNTQGITLATESENLMQSAKVLHISSLDLYWGLGWNKVNFLEFFQTSDLTHPYKGFRRIAEKVFSYLLAHL